jgi:ribosome-associated heat shock protein Hsp15
MNINIRIDKFLWAVRIYKTRSLSSEKCRKSQVLINGVEAKPSRIVKEGDIIEIKVPPIVRKYQVLKLLENRVGAKLVPEYIIELTPELELKKLFEKKINFVSFKPGSGRPTKRDRRMINKFLGDEQ